jgi:hypothetical protein
MGRYYSGDIEGKFWFAVQDSDDASFFGGEILEPSYISYSFDSDDLISIERGIAKCKKALGKNKKKLDEFFGKNPMYSFADVAEHVGCKGDEVQNLLTWYARLLLGKKIRDCVKKNGQCNFDADL